MSADSPKKQRIRITAFKRNNETSYLDYIRSMPAWSVSIVVHAIVLVVLAFLPTIVGAKNRPRVEINTRIEPKRSVEEFNQLLDEVTEATTDLSFTTPNPSESASSGTEGGSTGGSGGGLAGGSGPKVDQSRLPAPTVAARLGMGDLPGRGTLDLDIEVKGEGTVVVEDHQAVVDRLTREILRMLSKRKVLVVWMFDESLSMKDDQEDIASRFDKIYEELDLSGQAKGDALLTAVTSFGKDMHIHTEKPVSDIAKIKEAIANVPIDKSGEEWPCQHVIQLAKQYATMFTRGKRTVALIVVTDESGERPTRERKESDGIFVEDAIKRVQDIQMPIYVIGRQAIFGYPYARLVYTDPETGDRYHPQITRGPEAAGLECLQTEGLHTRWDEVSSGFGPYELERLAGDSGGIYFMLPTPELYVRERHYDPLDMKEYVPEYGLRKDYLAQRDGSPLRRAIFQVVTQTSKVGVNLSFSIEPPTLATQAEQAYINARRNRALLAAAYEYLDKVREEREREASQRWRAHYDLLCGQIFAYQVKLFEYEYFLQSFVSEPREPKQKPDKDYTVRWHIRHAHHRNKTWAPDEHIREPLEKAEKLLQDVVDRHPGTPWAVRAQTELRRGFSVDFYEWRRSRLYGQRASLVPKY